MCVGVFIKIIAKCIAFYSKVAANGKVNLYYLFARVIPSQLSMEIIFPKKEFKVTSHINPYLHSLVSISFISSASQVFFASFSCNFCLFLGCPYMAFTVGFISIYCGKICFYYFKTFKTFLFREKETNKLIFLVLSALFQLERKILMILIVKFVVVFVVFLLLIFLKHLKPSILLCLLNIFHLVG